MCFKKFQRDYDKLVEEKLDIVVTEDELKRIRNKYDKRWTKKNNKLQLADLKNGEACLNGVKLILGEWKNDSDVR